MLLIDKHSSPYNMWRLIVGTYCTGNIHAKSTIQVEVMRRGIWVKYSHYRWVYWAHSILESTQRSSGLESASRSRFGGATCSGGVIAIDLLDCTQKATTHSFRYWFWFRVCIRSSLVPRLYIRSRFGRATCRGGVIAHWQKATTHSFIYSASPSRSTTQL